MKREDDTNVEQWRDDLHRQLRAESDAVEEDEREGRAVSGYARRAKWASAYVWTDYYAQLATYDATPLPGVHAAIEAKARGATDEEALQAAELARKNAFMATREKYANLLRKD
jgi:hypothetical protein